MSLQQVFFHSLCGICYFPRHRHKFEGTNGNFLKTQATWGGRNCPRDGFEPLSSQLTVQRSTVRHPRPVLPNLSGTSLYAILLACHCALYFIVLLFLACHCMLYFLLVFVRCILLYYFFWHVIVCHTCLCMLYFIVLFFLARHCMLYFLLVFYAVYSCITFFSGMSLYAILLACLLCCIFLYYFFSGMSLYAILHACLCMLYVLVCMFVCRRRQQY